MARTLIHEEQRQQILDADALPLARSSYQIPNYSAAGKSIFAALSEKDESKDRVNDQRKGELDAGGVQIGKDETGNWRQVPAPKGSAAYQAGYYNALDNRFDAHFSTDLNNSLNAIQAEAGLDAAAKAQKMQATLAGVLKSAPAQYKARWETAGMEEIKQRGVLISQQAAKEQEKLVIADTQAALSRAEDELSSVAAAGGPTLKHEVEIDKHVDALVGIGALGKAEGELHKKTAREYGYGVALSRRVTNDVLAAKNDPDAVLEFGIKLENGGEAQINVTTFKPGPDGNLHPVLNTLSTQDVLKRLPSPKMRAAVAANIKEAARQFKSEAQAYAKDIELSTWMTTQGSNSYRTLPAHLKDEFTGLIEQHVAAGAFDSPEGRQKVSGLIKLAKVVPDIIIKNLSLELNGSEEKFHKAAAFIHDLRTAIGPDGGAIGDHIVQSIPEDLRNLYSAVELGIEYGHPLPEIRKAIQNQADPNGVSVTDAIELFNRSKTLTSQKFAASTKNAFQQLSGLDDLPPEAESDVQRLFHLHFLASRNADAAHAKAVKEVAGSYVKSNVFLGGYAKTHQLPLTNPTGYKTGKTFAYFRNTGYEWLNENISKNLVETATDLSAGDLAFLRSTNQPLGSAVFLSPTDSALERPQFEVWFKNKDGEVRPVHEKTSSGMRPLIVDPGADRAMIEHKATVYDAAESLRKAVDNQVNVLRDKLLNVPGLAPPGAVGSIIKEEDLRRFADPEKLKKYNVEVDALEKGYREYIDKLEKDTGIDVPDERIDQQSLMTPKLSGPDIVTQVAGYIDELLPDGTGGAFLQRIAATESDFGRAGGTFRMKGDKGIWQINTGSAFVEVQRLIKQGKGRVFEAHEHIKSKTGIDLSKVSMDDLDKPLISGLFARLYFERKGSKIPNDVVGQARLWKDYYNTYLGTGTPGHFIRASGKVELAEALPAKGAPMKKPVYEKTWGEIWDELMDRQGWAEMYDKSITKAVFDNLFGEAKRTEAFGGNPKDDFEGAMAILIDDYGMDLAPGALDDAPASDKIIDMRNWDDDKIAREGMVSLIQYALRTQELTNDYHSRRGNGPPIPVRKPANLKMVHAVSQFVLEQKQRRSEITDLLMKEGGNDRMTRKKKKKPLKVTIPGK